MEKIKEVKKVYEPKIWKVLTITIIIGIVFIFLVSFQALFFGHIDTDPAESIPANSFKENLTSYFITVGMGLLVAGSCFTIGGLLGFLFGIPRSINSNNPEMSSSKNQIMQNDNLVQISDWITKIMVGVGLTQIYQIGPNLIRLGDYLAPAFDSHGIGETSAPIIGVIIVLYYLVVGFLSSYLWTRLHFSTMLAQNQDVIDEIQNDLESKEQELARKEIELNEKEIALTKTENEVKALTTSFSQPILALKTKQTDHIIELDTNKGKYGGKPENNGRILTATVETTSYDSELFTISLVVSSTDAKNMLTGDVTFYLRPNSIDPMEVVTPIDGKANLNIIDAAAFTVGVICDEGNTLLELDLALIPNAPALFKGE